MTPRIRHLAILLTLTLTCSLNAHADEASRRAKAQQMVDLIHMDRMIKQLMDGMMAQMTASERQMAGSSVTPEQQAKLDAFQSKVFAFLDAQMGWKAMQPIYIDLYAKTFTDDELDGIIAFYKSPAGVAIVEKTPALTTQAQQIVQQKLTTLAPQLKQMVQDFANEMTPPASSKP